MLPRLRSALRLAVAAGSMLLGACTISNTTDKPATDTAAASAQTAPAPAPATTAQQAPPTTAAESSAQALTMGTAVAKPLSDMRLEVDLKARKLHVYQGDKRTGTYPVAVGSTEWPTKTGEWYVTQVVLNPEWIPPDQSWAEQAERREPGDPKNPLGAAQLIYDPPRTVHGTNEPASIGKAVSHGSIRMANADILALARQALDAGGVPKDDAWFQAAQANRSKKEIVDLQQQIAIRVF